MTRRTLELPFGGGLDRKTGSAVVDPTSFGNLQNVHLFRGRMELRKGLERALDLGWGEDIIAVEPVRAQGLTACVVWDSVTRDVRLYLVDGSLAAASLVGTLWTMPAVIVGRPRVTAADMYDKLVIAHDEPALVARQVTRVFTVSGSSIANLTSDLDRNAVAEDVKFRGVRRHLNYLVGWGYGTGASEDRPEVLRISLPGTTDFVPEHYFLVGARGDPILGAGKSGGVLEVCKAAEAYKLVGYSRETFGMQPMDDNHGQLNSKLAVTVGNERFRWGLHGPRSSSGGESVDLEMPLDIAGPDADPLLSATEADNGFAFYDPSENEVLFVFDHWAYVLHMRDGERRWSYRPYAWEIASAGIIYTGGVALLSLAEPVLAPATYSDPPFVGPDDEDYLPEFGVSWSNSGTLLGGEQAEVWVRSLYDDAWAKRTTVAATALAATVAGMHFLTNHEIAVRLTLDGVPGLGYTGSPETWPGHSRVTVLAEGTFTLLLAPFGGFNRTSAAALTRDLDFTGPGMAPSTQPQLTYEVEKSLTGVGAWSSAGTNPLLASHDHADRHQEWYYRLRATGPDATSAYVVSGAKWLGPEAPDNVNGVADDGGAPGFHNELVTCDYTGEADAVEFRVVHQPAGVTSTATGAVSAGSAQAFVLTANASVPAPQTATAGARGSWTQFGETDLSEWVDDPSPVAEP